MLRLVHLLSVAFSVLNKISHVNAALTPYTGPPPRLPNRHPFGFASNSTGGAGGGVFLVDNMSDLREALTTKGPKTVYVKGRIDGNEINSTFKGDCQWYIDTSPVKQFNFTMYLKSFNSTYMAMVSEAAVGDEMFEGRNATEYLALLKRQNGWRSQAQNSQKKWVGIDMTDDTTLIGFDENSRLAGVRLGMNVINNVHIRNLKLEPPPDCFPAPETFPATWNARYDAISLVTSTNVWIDGNTFQDADQRVPLEPFIDGWYVDRADGLFDAEDGSDNITFSHNIVRNHHKSLLFGGGNKEADRSLGKMRFTLFANHFVNSDSRNPLMRFGTFMIYNNLFSSTNNQPSLYSGQTTALDPLAPKFEYHLGIYNQSRVLLQGNAFLQSGSYASDLSRIFVFRDLTRADIPAKLCIKPFPLGNPNVFNRLWVNLKEVAREKFSWQILQGQAIEGGLVLTCEGFLDQNLPKMLWTGIEVESYVRTHAGQQSY